MPPPLYRTQYCMPRALHRQLKAALRKRTAAAKKGRERARSAATISGWIQEEARKFIAAQT